MQNILVVGKGYVGSAVVKAFKKNIIFVAEPKINTKISDFKNKKIDFVFVCVDTPKGENFNTLHNVLREINDTFKNHIVIIKSTALPSFFKKIHNEFKNIKLVHYPEFLSHWNNINDFLNQKFCILGGELPICKKVANLLKSNLKKLKTIKFTNLETAALIKYAENSFLALKVTFANELYNIIKANSLPCTYEEFVELLVLDERIGKSHLQVPGRDGRKGWGGHCFEKDTYEFVKEYSCNLIDYVRKLNKLHRDE